MVRGLALDLSRLVHVASVKRCPRRTFHLKAFVSRSLPHPIPEFNFLLLLTPCLSETIPRQWASTLFDNGSIW